MNDRIELDDQAEINVAEIMRRIQEYIAERRTQEDLQTVLALDLDLGGNLSPDLYEHMTQAIRANASLGVESDARRTRVPVVGPVLDVVRRSIHQLVLFYVNKAIAKQVAVNSETLKALQYLVAEVEQLRATQAMTDPEAQ